MLIVLLKMFLRTKITCLIWDFQVGHMGLPKAESMMEKQQETGHAEIESEQENELQEVQQQQQVKEENLLQFLDSVDSYLTLLDSLSSTLRQVRRKYPILYYFVYTFRVGLVMIR
ncbi:hypothetical protein Dsin_019187 [Dipteronia sinensis]|uniref:Uncharacterized protein n=1 Tax=Dipteronia sinensis TaxID=43782 RepID=A0AAE0A883_9ROSI|nr:hypothetical protein Dsin_019187 [Dipteronia sinensis]